MLDAIASIVIEAINNKLLSCPGVEIKVFAHGGRHIIAIFLEETQLAQVVVSEDMLTVADYVRADRNMDYYFRLNYDDPEMMYKTIKLVGEAVHIHDR